ncbi:MAG: phage tail protein [Lachnospiraceae bacterium]|nr:phage tail protein [Lachnospiraceae bacterium]GFI02302.1 hypothetical protein IMSAGC005_01130 [Lachnospiraceae bacterium]
MFEELTYEVLLKRMLGRVSNKYDKREGSVIWDTHSPTAIELKNLYIALDSIVQEAYGDTATREFLIMRCKERGIVPYPATHAVLKGEFLPDHIDVTGKRFNIGQINYLVTDRLPEGGCKVQCEAAGEEGNRYLGTMTPIEYINGLVSAELTELLIPGEDEEGTEELRQRYFSSFDVKAFGGNVKDYLEKTNAIPGVGCTKVTRVWNGDIRPAEMIPPMEVETWYGSASESLPDSVKEWFTAVYTAAKEKKLTTGGSVLLTILNSAFDTASQELVETVQKAMDPEAYGGEGYGLAPIGHLVSVKSAEGVQITVKIKITFDHGYNWTKSRSAIEDAINGYFSELRREWADTTALVVRISQIETRILGIKGIVDVEDTMLNDHAENLILGAFEVPVFGGVSE